MFAATDKSIWGSDDWGQTWAEKTDGLPWKEIQGFAGGSDSYTSSAATPMSWTAIRRWRRC